MQKVVVWEQMEGWAEHRGTGAPLAQRLGVQLEVLTGLEDTFHDLGA
jgi:hypothetical protein